MNLKSKLIVLDADSAILREVLSASRQWYDVLATPDFKQAATWLRDQMNVAVLVCEYAAPCKEARQLLEFAQEKSPDTRRIVMSNYLHLPNIIQGMHTGIIQKLIEKPIDRNELLAAIVPSGAMSTFSAATPTRIARAG